MEDMNCILDNSLINERKIVKRELYEGPSLDILAILVNGEKTTSEISRILDLPQFSIKLYLSRLLKGGLIKESKTFKEGNVIDRAYQLSTTNLNMINSTPDNQSHDELKEECSAMAEHFNRLQYKAISNIYKYDSDAYLIKSSYIKVNKSKIPQFKEKLEALLKEFNDLEDLDEEMVFGLMVNLTPFEYDN